MLGPFNEKQGFNVRWFYLAMGVFGMLFAGLFNKVLEVTGGYSATLMMLLALIFAAPVLNIFIRKP